MYLFTWESPFNAALRASHGIDIAFTFGNFVGPMATIAGAGRPEARGLVDTVMDAWIAFARSGEPCAWTAGEAAIRPLDPRDDAPKPDLRTGERAAGGGAAVLRVAHGGGAMTRGIRVRGRA